MKKTKTDESGRSMVEILGVLAVIGVLSVAGIAGYTNVMNKHKANELLNEANKRAVVVVGQLLNKNTADLSEFQNQSVAGGTFTDRTVTKDENGQFTLTINNVETAICDHMQKAKGLTVQKFEPENCELSAIVKLTFNADLSQGGTTDRGNIDPSIKNQTDCENAGKTWCLGLKGGTGACSNITDCCANVSVTNPCQKCVSGTGEIVNKMDAASCDTGNGPGICYPVEPTGGSCSGTNLETLCLNGVQFQPSATSMCLPVSCKTLEAMNLSTCCYEYNFSILQQNAMNALMNDNMPRVYDMADQINISQCTSCNPDTGETTKATDGARCEYLDVPTYIDSQETLAGRCKNGKCVEFVSDGRFCDYYTNGQYIVNPSEQGATCHQYHSCNDSDPVWIDDINELRNECLACGNKTLAFPGKFQDSTYCIPKGKTIEGLFFIDKDTEGFGIFEAYDCQLLGSYNSPNEASCVNGCQNTPFQRQYNAETGKCTLSSCPSGYYSAGSCVPCNVQPEEGDSAVLININSKIEAWTLTGNSTDCSN